MLEARRALEDEDRVRQARRRHEDRAAVVGGRQFPGGLRHLHRVDRRRRARRRHAKAFTYRLAVAGQAHLPDVERPSVLEQPDVDGVARAMRDEVGGDLGERVDDRDVADRDVADLAVHDAAGRADADGKHRQRAWR